MKNSKRKEILVKAAEMMADVFLQQCTCGSDPEGHCCFCCDHDKAKRLAATAGCRLEIIES